MTSMKDAVRRLKLIDEACNPKGNTEELNVIDYFTKTKKDISQKVKCVRQLIKEREEHNGTEKSRRKPIGSGTESAELSFKIRTILKEVRELCGQLDSNVKKSEKKLKNRNRPELQEALESRRVIVKLCFQHLEECEMMDKARFNEKLVDDRVSLLSPNNSTLKTECGKLTFPAGLKNTDMIADRAQNFKNSDLPDIEVQEDLAIIRERGCEIDRELNEISAGVSVIKQIAMQMGEEVEKQNELLSGLEDKVDKTQDHMETVNEKMKQALDSMMKGDKFLVNCVLVCILLGLIAYIASLVIPV